MSERDLTCVKDLRVSIVDAIKTANITGIGSNVYSSRMESAWPEEDSFVVVYIPSVSFDDGRTSPRYYKSNATVIIDVYARSYVSAEGGSIDDMDGVADFLDDSAKAIIEALQPIESMKGPFNGLVKRLVLKSWANNLSEKGEAERGSMRITFEADFAVTVTYGGPKDDFVKAKNTLKMGSGAGNQMVFDTTVQFPPTPTPEPEPEPEETEPVENDET